mgnify:CR=1 FL=1
MLYKTLAYFNDNKAKAAEALGITTKTIYNRLAGYQAKGQGREASGGVGDFVERRLHNVPPFAERRAQHAH